MRLKTLTSLNKDSRPFSLAVLAFRVFPSVSSLSDYSIWEVAIAFAACELIFLKYDHRLGKVDKKSLDS